MANSDLAKWRSTVIERAINVEWLMNAIICQHYFGKVVTPFVLEVLNSEHFSFGLKRGILERILGKQGKKTISHLHLVGEIRNRFAHSGPHLVTVDQPDGFAPDPKNPERSLDFAALYKKFEELCPTVEAELAQIFVSKGGKLSTTPWPAV